MRHSITTLLLLGLGCGLGGCGSWFRDDPYESRLNQLPEPASGLERLVELRKQHARRQDRPLELSDPRYMDKARKRSERDRRRTLEAFQKKSRDSEARRAQGQGASEGRSANWLEKLFSTQPKVGGSRNAGP